MKLTAGRPMDSRYGKGQQKIRRSRQFPPLKWLGLAILAWILLFGISACTPARLSPEKAIVGQWVNDQGGIINFYADNTGFIPGVEGQTLAIPSVKFTYYFKDETSLAIVMDGQAPVVVEIKLEGDKMTWRSLTNNAEFVYKRAQ